MRNTKRITGQVSWAGSERYMAPSLLCGQATIRVNSNIGGPRKKKRYEKNADGAVLWGGWVSRAQCLSYYKNWFQRVTVIFFLSYLTHASENKQEVDPTPVLWTATDPTGADLDAYAESQKPYNCRDEVERRQKREMAGGDAGKSPKFGKYDLVNVVAHRGFRTPAEITQWTKSSAGAAAKKYVVNNMRNLRTIIQDAEKWMDPSEVADPLDVNRPKPDQ